MRRQRDFSKGRCRCALGQPHPTGGAIWRALGALRCPWHRHGRHEKTRVFLTVEKLMEPAKQDWRAWAPEFPVRRVSERVFRMGGSTGAGSPPCWMTWLPRGGGGGGAGPWALEAEVNAGNRAAEGGITSEHPEERVTSGAGRTRSGPRESAGASALLAARLPDPDRPGQRTGQEKRGEATPPPCPLPASSLNQIRAGRGEYTWG